MKILGIIPARYASSRFPGKPLVDINGISMINRVYQQASKTSLLNKVVVATDDKRIYDEVISHGGAAVMTAENHRSGTERCHEVVEKLSASGENYDVAINIQGDEPFIEPSQIDRIAALFTNAEIKIATLVKEIKSDDELFSPNVVKVVLGKDKKALYFSRQPIPYLRGVEQNEWVKIIGFYKHIGIYAYRTEVLAEIVKLPVGKLEDAESLEQLRWLENDFSVYAEETDFESIAVDTPEDLRKIINILNSNKQV
jgi:3-deoxy-manno-octulosonate cytidylyltransferase (CMP-KDO synthetase)